MATTQEYGLGEFDFPRGWFVVAVSEDATNKPIPLRYFGRDMILYRGQNSGKPVIMDAYCPHMKTHLAKNETSYVVLDGKQTEGDDIRCPYHGWKFGPDGKCNEIPYSPAPIPKAAKIRAYPTQEWGGFILMWHDEEEGEPDFEPHPLPEWEDPKWVNWKVDHLGVLPCHQQEIVDNIMDKAHLSPIHGSMNMDYFESEIDGISVRQVLAAGHRTLADDVLTNDTWYTGPGLLMSRMLGYYNSLLLVAHTPVEDGTTRAWHALMVEPPNMPMTAEDEEAVAAFQEGSKMALLQDFDVWKNKAPCIQIMQVIGDGPFGKVRDWYRQFFNPRKDAAKYQAKANGKWITKGTNRDPWPQADAAE